jgi:hypothetical protein
MDLQPYVDNVRHELSVAAAVGGSEAEALAHRLTAPLESAIRLALLEALSAAAEEITRELAPASVEVRLRGHDLEFGVTAAPADAPRVAPAEFDDDGGTWRVTLRLPEGLRPTVERGARREGISLNAWLVRAAAAAAEATSRRHDASRHVTGWVR